MRISFIVLLAQLVLASTAVAQTAQLPPSGAPVQVDAPFTDEERKAVSLLLTAYHELPARSEFERVARSPQTILRAIATKGSGPFAERAIEALFLWPSDETYAFALELLGAPDATAGRQQRLLMLLCRELGARAIPVAAPFLQHEDRAMRITAAAALASTDADEAFTLVERALAIEQDATTRKAMERYARRLR